MSSPRCSIVIRAYNEEAQLGHLLAAILQQTMKDFEIILVDSGSTDSTVSIASEFPVKIVQISPQEFTFGRSLNLGIAEARGEFIVIASAHVYPLSSNWLIDLLAPFDDPRVALSYGAQRGAETTKFSEGQHFLEWFPEQSNLQQTQAFCNNANAAIRRALWQGNPYDETLTGLEDIAWASWALEQGYHLAYVAEAQVVHVHDERPAQTYNRYRREAIALKRLLPNSRFRLRHALSHFLRYAAKDARAARQQGLLLRELASILQFRLLQYWGTYRGYRHSGQLSEQLRQTFYYSPKQLEPSKRHSDPLARRESGEAPNLPLEEEAEA